MKRIYIFITACLLCFSGCQEVKPDTTGKNQTANNAPTQAVQTQKIAGDERSGFQKYTDLIETGGQEIKHYETSKPEGFIRFRWNPQFPNDLNFSSNADHELYALVDPNFQTDDLHATQVFYLEVVKDNGYLYYGPFETIHLDFTQ